MESLRSKKGFICDMDGVIYHGNQLLPGVKEFVEWLQKEEKQFLFLTNASSRSPKELQNKLYRMGLEIGEEHFYTSALATAKFLQNQAPGYEHNITAMNLVNKGARLIATNTDITGPIEGGIAPACRAFVAPIEATTGKKAYYVGKPNPLMMRTGLQILGVHSSEAVMIGDRMDTDIIAGIETGLDTALVLSGVSTRETVKEFPYRPRLILNGVGDIAE